MKVTLENGDLKINLTDALDHLSADEKRSVADHLACQDSIIEDVAAQLLTGWTDAGSHGGRSCGADPEPHSPIDRARREIAARASDVAKKEIEDLKSALQSAQDAERKYREWGFALYHRAIANGYTPIECPK